MVSASTNSSPLLGLSDSLADAVEKAGRSVVTVNARGRLPSSGIHWRQGLILTADHTVERDDGITVTLPGGQNVPVKVAGRDSGTDLAALRIENADLPVAEIGDSSTLKVGHLVLALGRPGETGLSASFGTVSAVGGSWRTWGGGQIDTLIRPDVTFYPGFSGGPLVDGQGRVLGLNTSGLSRSMGLTIPTSTVERVTEQLLTRGRVARGYLGLGMQPVRLPENLQQSLGLSSNRGLIVVSVQGSGPAEQAGILMGDVLISLGGQQVSDTGDVQGVLYREQIGQAVPVKLIRGGQPVEVTLTIGERPGREE
jgi:S1-C subfamily serine protease